MRPSIICIAYSGCMYMSCVTCRMFVYYPRTHTPAFPWGASVIATCAFFTCLEIAPDSVTLFQQAKKGLLTLTVRTRLTTPPSLCSHLSPPLCRSLSSSTCGAQDRSPFSLESPASPASAAKPNYRVMVEVSLQKGRSAVPVFCCWPVLCPISSSRLFIVIHGQRS